MKYSKKKKCKEIIIFLLFFIITNFLCKERKFKDIIEYPEYIIDQYKIYFDIINMENSFDFFNKNNKIKNVLILITIFPFLKKEIIITKKNPSYGFLKKIFHLNNMTIIKLCKNNITQLTDNFEELLYYKWNYLPSKNETNYIRYILSQFYPEKYSTIFGNSLNLNIKNYIEKNKNKISFKFVTDLMSKN